MSPADRENLRRQLEARARQILHSTHEQVEEATSAPEVRTDVLDSTEESLVDSIQTTRADLTDRDQQLLTLIRDALVRHRDGTYGVCIDCGEEIGLERLRAVPWAPRCADDQEQFEAAQRTESPTM